MDKSTKRLNENDDYQKTLEDIIERVKNQNKALNRLLKKMNKVSNERRFNNK